MAPDEDFVKFVTDQIRSAGMITCRKMFGDYTIYSNGKVVALVCDNQLFVKPTTGGRAFIGEVTEGHPILYIKFYSLGKEKQKALISALDIW